MRLFFSFFWGVLLGGQSLFAASPLQVKVSAASAILINAETGAVLYEKNAHMPLFPASITKVATALYAIEKKGDALEDFITASQDAVVAVSPSMRRASDKKHPPYRLEFGGTHMGIKAGEILSLRTLLYGLMLTSSNDAANVIAQYVSGSIPQFMEELNGFMRELGCTGTSFSTPHGLTHPDHKTTAYDMARLTQRALKHPFFREIVRTVKYPRGMTNKQPDSDLVQHNALLKPGKLHYPKAIGVKTGYTASAGYTMVAAAEDESRSLIAVLLGCPQLAQRYQDAIALFEAAFNEQRVSRTLFSHAFDHFSCALKGAQKSVVADLATDLILHYYPSEEPEFVSQVIWNDLKVPIRAGQLVGEVQIVSREGKIVAQEPLFAVQQVDATWQYQALQAWLFLKQTFQRSIALVLTGIGLLFIAIAFYFFHHRRSNLSNKSRNCSKESSSGRA